MSIFIPKEGEEYSRINNIGNIDTLKYYAEGIMADMYNHDIKSGNCYRTEEEAERSRDKSYAVRELEVLADELNAGVKIDWDNAHQTKYFICNSGISKEIEQYEAWFISDMNIYCLSDKFLEVALEKLGESKLRLILDVKEV